MPGVPAWRMTPRGRRSIGEIANALDSQRGFPVALLVGAGVDQAISGRPGWTAMLDRLGQGLDMNDDRKSALLEVARGWPMETAEALRVSLGPAEFSRRLHETLPPLPRGIAFSAPLAVTIAGMVQKGVGVIVTMNYTDDLCRALRHLLPTSFRVRVIDNTELSAWPLGRMFKPLPGDVHIIKIHGSLPEARSNSSAGVMLDRSSYDLAMTAESPYLEILARLFEDFAVFSLGVSGSDVPLRDAAARVKQRLPVARPMHYVARQQASNGATDWWEERALTSAYGLRPLYYAEHGEVSEMTAEIVNLAGARPPAGNAPLPVIASWLDRFGDFESHQQSRWFAKQWSPVSESIRDACAPGTVNAENWLASAQIERHLRHFLWFWLHPSQRQEYRRELWSRISDAWELLTPAEREELWDDAAVSEVLEWNNRTLADASRYRAVLDFAIGAHEVMGSDESNPSVQRWLDSLRRAGRYDVRSVTGRRIAVASRVWSSPASSDLVRTAQDACWEAIEAKVALDMVEDRIAHEYASSAARSPRDFPGGLRHRLWKQSEYVRSLSRVAGCNRREAGAIVLASLLAPYDQAEGDLIAAYRRVADLSGGRPEPTAAWSILIGLIALFVDQAGGKVMDNDLIEPLSEWLTDKCGPITVDAALAEVVNRNYATYWSGFHNRAANLAPKVAEHLFSP
jgi:hypothetical protein